MDFLTAFLLGALQGALEFLPVSSTGHLAVLERLIGFDVPFLPFHVFLHVGSAAAVVWIFRRDVIRLLAESGRMLADCLKNIREFLSSLRKGEDPAYIKIVRTNYRKLVIQLLIVSVPTACIGFLLKGTAKELSHSAMYTGIGLLITGIMLLVASMIRPRNEMPRDIPDWKILMIGIAQGFSVLPGISRFGVTLSGGILCGLSAITAIRISFLMLIPAVSGALAEELMTGIPAGTFDGNTLILCLTGMAASALTGLFVMKRVLRFVRVRGLKGFAGYCFIAGLVFIFLGFLI